jgi:dihydrofolate reductase
MGALTLQMQTTVDGYVAARRPDLSWQVWDWGPDWTWDEELKRRFNATFEHVDTVLLSRKMVEEGYIEHWTRTAAANPHDSLYAFARTIVELPKVVVTSQRIEPRWPRTRIATGGFVNEVTALKNTHARIICFGGASFASALVAQGLVDEYQFFINPTAIGAGLSIFTSAVDGLPLQLVSANAYDCGIVVNEFRAL